MVDIHTDRRRRRLDRLVRPRRPAQGRPDQRRRRSRPGLLRRAAATEPTVTDANLVLGRLCAERPDRRPHAARSATPRAARSQPIARAPRLHRRARPRSASLAIVVANMVRAIRAVSVERGHDPRGFALMPFGGAGPLHAAEVARSLGMREILVPPAPGILCAAGPGRLRPEGGFRAHACARRLDAAPRRAIAAQLDELVDARPQTWFAHEGVEPARAHADDVTLDMRYVGQNFELPVPIGTPARRRPSCRDRDDLRSCSSPRTSAATAIHNADDPIEIVNVRLTARGALRADRRRHAGSEPRRSRADGRSSTGRSGSRATRPRATRRSIDRAAAAARPAPRRARRSSSSSTPPRCCIPGDRADRRRRSQPPDRGRAMNAAPCTDRPDHARDPLQRRCARSPTRPSSR